MSPVVVGVGSVVDDEVDDDADDGLFSLIR